jgi:hypothetical protein
MKKFNLVYAGLLAALLAAPAAASADGTQMASAISLWRSARPAGAFKRETNMGQRVDWKRAATMSGLWTGKVDYAGISNATRSNGRMVRCGHARHFIAAI